MVEVNSMWDFLTVGEIAKRSGVPVSTIHFYESKGLISSERTGANQRRFDRTELRRIAIIRVAVPAGISLNEIRDALATLPAKRSVTAKDWARLSRRWTSDLDD